MPDNIDWLVKELLFFEGANTIRHTVFRGHVCASSTQSFYGLPVGLLAVISVSW